MMGTSALVCVLAVACDVVHVVTSVGGGLLLSDFRFLYFVSLFYFLKLKYIFYFLLYFSFFFYTFFV